MKAILVILSCLSLSVFSQVQNTNYLFKNSHIFTKPTGAVIDLGSSITSFQGTTMGSFSFGLHTDVMKNVLAGFSFNMFQSRHPRFNAPVEVINPRFNLSTFTLDQEYLFLKDKAVNFSLYNKVGMACAQYNDAYYQQYYYTGKTSGSRPRTVMDRYYFTDEVGANVNFNLCKHVSLCAGSSYRVVSGSSSPFGSASGLGGWNANVKLRFKISDR